MQSDIKKKILFELVWASFLLMKLRRNPYNFSHTFSAEGTSKYATPLSIANKLTKDDLKLRLKGISIKINKLRCFLPGWYKF